MAPISERVNELIPANTVALAMSLQIPTFYKYMAYYDQGIIKPIPELVLGFLRLVDAGATPEAAKEYISNHLERRDEVPRSAGAASGEKLSDTELIEKRIAGAKDCLASYDAAIIENTDRVSSLRAELGAMPESTDPEASMRIDVVRKQIESTESQIEKLREMRSRTMSELDSLVKEYETVTGGVVGKKWTAGDIRTLSIGDGGRSMVVFDTVGTPSSTVIELTIETPYGTMPVATVRPREGYNYVSFDDIVPAAGVFYEVVETYPSQVLRSGRFRLQFE